MRHTRPPNWNHPCGNATSTVALAKKPLRCRGSRAYVTTLRSPEYLVLVKELHCSIQEHSSPDMRLIVLSVAGDLDASVIADVQSFAEYREVEELTFSNDWFPRQASAICWLPPLSASLMMKFRGDSTLG